MAKKEKPYLASFVVETRPFPTVVELEFYADNMALARDHADQIAHDYNMRRVLVRHIPCATRAGTFYDSKGNVVDLNSRR